MDSPAIMIKAIDVISELVTEVRMKINESGITY